MRFNLPGILLLLTLSFPSTLFGQKNFKPGYVILNSQDTLDGFINYRNWARNPVSVEFRSSLHSEIRTYHLRELVSFGVNDERYFRSSVLIDESSSNPNSLSFSPVPKMKADTALLRLIINGPKSLYYLVTRDGKRLLYIRQGDDFQLLTYYQYNSQTESTKIIEVKDFKEQLLSYLDDCLSLKKDITPLEYELNSISKLFEKYYKCTRAEPAYSAKREHLSVQGGISGGVSRSKLSPNGIIGHYYNTLKPSFMPSIGGFLKVVFPRTNQRLSLNNEIFFTSMNSTEHFQENSNNGDYVYRRAQYSLGYIKLHNFIRYKILSGQYGVFISGGISNGFKTHYKSHFEYQATYQGKGNYHSGKILNAVKKQEQGLMFSLGAEIKKINVDLRCELSNGASADPSISAPLRRLYLTASYTF